MERTLFYCTQWPESCMSASLLSKILNALLSWSLCSSKLIHFCRFYLFFFASINLVITEIWTLRRSVWKTRCLFIYVIDYLLIFAQSPHPSPRDFPQASLTMRHLQAAKETKPAGQAQNISGTSISVTMVTQCSIFFPHVESWLIAILNLRRSMKH